jgi:polyferredoxin
VGWLGVFLFVDLVAGLLVGFPFGRPTVLPPAAWAGLGDAVLSPGFLLAAFGETLGLAAWRWNSSPRFLGLLGVAQGALILLSPSWSPSGSWGALSAVLGAGVTILAFAAILQWIYRNKQLAPSVFRYLIAWAVGATALGAGGLLWRLDGSSGALLVALLLEAGVALSMLPVPRDVEQEERIPWLLRPSWAFLLLLFTFLGEFFIGALLDLEVSGSRFLGYIPYLPIAGAGPGALSAAVYDGLWFSAAIMASAWFLIAIGITMGALVVLRIRDTRERPQRYRMALMLAVYALAAVYLPSLASSTPIAYIPALENLPVIGWGFGLRAGGPFESGIFLAVLIMYASVGALTVLFGRKALCSVMCGAALMYQGTAIHEMRRFNQSSRIGRYFLGSQLSTAYVVASSLALVSLFAVSLLSYLQSLPHVEVANGLIDTAALPLPIELYFGGLWFVMFVSTPYIGTYNCATTGFCHWGALSVPFAKVGLFRLKVKDRRVCQACTTFDCAKACPVGLVDMPEHFRATGEYRSTKCCGVGDCVGACPYGNMYHQDVRFWLRRKRSGPVPSSQGTPLPMLRGSGGALPGSPPPVSEAASRLSSD